MPRSRGSGGGRAPSRPTAAPARPAPPPQRQQTRPASTTAGAAPGQKQQQQQQSGGSGLFGQMASTAAGVAVGSSIGHAIGGFFGGGSSAAPVEEAQSSYATNYDNNASVNSASGGYGSQAGAGACEMDARNFTRCLDEHGGNMQICGWYLEQLKACQKAAGGY